MAIGIFRKIGDWFKKAGKKVWEGVIKPVIRTAPKVLGIVAPAVTAINPAVGAGLGAAAAGTAALSGLVDGKKSFAETMPALKTSAQKIMETASPFIKFKKA